MSNVVLDTGSPKHWMSRLSLNGLRDYGVYVVFVILVVFNLLFTSNFAHEGSLMIQLIQVAPVVVISLGMALVIGTGGIDLSVGAVMAMASAMIAVAVGLAGIYALILALVVGFVSGLLAGTLVAFVRVQPIIATLAFMVGLRGLAQILVQGNLVEISNPFILSLGQGKVIGIPLQVIVAAILVIVMSYVIRRTIFGKYIVAIGSNRRASILSGHPVRMTLLWVYGISGLLAAFAGVIATAQISATDASNIGLLYELQAITAVVVGGTPLTGGRIRIMGTVFGALVMQLINATFIMNNLSPTWAEVMEAVIILVAVYIQRGRGAA